jgi:hypothetical protein
MTRFSFYKNLNKYKDNSLSHGIGSKLVSSVNKAIGVDPNYGKLHYQKIDNYYGPGKSRYFYSKEEWDAYQREQAAINDRARKEVEQRNQRINQGQGAANAAKQRADTEKYNNQVSSTVRKAQSGREAAIKNSLNQQQAQKNLDNARVQEAQRGREAAIKNSGRHGDELEYYNKLRQESDKIQAQNNIRKRKETEQKRKDQDFVKDLQNERDYNKKNNVNIKNSDYHNYHPDKPTSQSNKSDSQPNVSKEYQQEKEYNTTGKTSGGNNAKASQDQQHKSIIDDAFKPGTNANDLASKYNVSTEYIQEVVYNSTGKMIPTKSQQQQSNNGSSNNSQNKSTTNNSGPVVFTYEDGKTKRKR